VGQSRLQDTRDGRAEEMPRRPAEAPSGRTVGPCAAKRPDSSLLEGVALFQFHDDNERAELAAELEVVNFKAGVTVFQVGDPGEAPFLLRTGRFGVFIKNDTGERIVLVSMSAGGFVGEISLLDSGPRSASVVHTVPLQPETDNTHMQTRTWPGSSATATTSCRTCSPSP
jgi:hypothetical protein